MVATTRSRSRRRYLVRRWSRRARGLLGGILTVVAGLALWLAFLGGLLAAAVTLDSSSGLDPALRAEIWQAWLWVVAVGASAWYSARTLRAVPRRMVLWLRRFRHAESIRAVSTALDHLGYSWRVVTLDDSTAQPSGAPPGLRLTSSLGATVRRVVATGQRWVSAGGGWVVRAYVGAWVALVAWTVWRGRPLAVLEALSGDWTQWPVPAEVFAARFLAGAFIAWFVALLAFIVVMLGLILLLPLMMLTGAVGEGVQKAERGKRQRVTTLSQLTEVAATVAAGSRAALAPRLTVVTVATPIWREAVHAFARVSHAVLLDVSTASEALLWEVGELGGRDTRVVFVGEEGAVSRLLSQDEKELGAADSALRRALDGCEVITYRTTLRGRVRFQRALYGALEATAPLRLSLVSARRWALTVVAVGLVVIGLGQVAAIVTSWPWARLVE